MSTPKARPYEGEAYNQGNNSCIGFDDYWFEMIVELN